MGGIGSGRRRGSITGPGKGKRETNESLGLDVRALHRAGHLQPGTCRRWQWSTGAGPDARPAGSIGFLVQGRGITLEYVYRGETVTQSVELDWTPCNYGGRRPWWRCPNCARRVAVLYGAGKFFACRQCHGLCYSAQLENCEDRLLRAAWKIRRQLGQTDGGHLDAPPLKPGYMRWPTYSRLVSRCRGLECSSLGIAAQRFDL